MDIIIYNADGSLLRTAPVTSSAELEQKLMDSDKVTLSWNDIDDSLIPMGAYLVCPLNNQRYYMLNPYYPQVKAIGKYEYKPEFSHEVQMLAKIPFLFYTYDSDGNVATVESDWNFTGSGQDLAASLAAAIYEGIGVKYAIAIDESIEAALSLSFSNQDILSSVNSIAEAWGCEWWTDEQIAGTSTTKIMHFGEMCIHEGSATSILSLVAGQHVDCPNSNQKATFYNRFYIFGSTQNIPQNYEGAQANHVVNKRLTLNPDKFPYGYIDLPKFDSYGNALKDSDGNYILDESLANTNRRFVKVIQLEDIYPKSNCRIKYGSLKSCARYVRDDNDKPVVLSDGKYDTWYIYLFRLEYLDDTTGTWKDFTINKSTYSETSNPGGNLIKGKTLSLHFNSGALEGREFEATYHDAAKTFRADDNSTTFSVTAGYFEVVHTEDNTIIIPNTGIEPKEATSSTSHDGDEVVVFNIRMPDSYYNTAYKELEEEGIKQIYELTKDSNEYTVKSNQVYFAKNNPLLTLGRHVNLVIGSRTIDTRVKSLTTKLDRAYEQSISFSKSISKGTISTIISTVESTQQNITEVSVKDDTAVKMSKQKLYEAQRELYNSMFDTDGYFTEPVAPSAIKTALVKVGATSTNFQLEGVVFEANYNDGAASNSFPNNFRVVANQGKIIHYGLSLTSDSPSEWSVANQDISSSLTSNASLYYLYAVCPSDGSTCSFYLSTEQIKYNSKLEVDGCYYFLTGTLSSVVTDGNDKSYRILSTTYGCTTVAGRFLSTGRIESVDKATYFDLDTGEIRGNIEFNASEDNTALINNIINANTIVAGAASSATSALSTAKEALAKAEEAAGEVNPNLLRGTEYMRIGDGTWESASFRQGGYGGTLSYVSDIKAETGEAAPIDGLSGAIKITANYDWADNDDGVEVAWINQKNGFCQDNYTGLSKGDVVVLSAYVWSSGNLAMSLSPVWAVDATSLTTTVYLKRGWNKVASAPMTLPTTEAYNLCNIYIIAQETEYEYLPTEGLTCIVCGAKLEKGTEATAWREANEDKNYLKEAIAEATQGTTTLGGGLVLSKYMGVRDSSGVIVAGMSGTSQATAGTLPMIWAGATANSTDGQKAAAFRVNGNSGEVVMTKGKIVGGEGSNGMVIENGTIKLGTVASETIPDNKVNMLISPTTGMTSISTIINATSTADVSGTLTDPSSTSASQQWSTSGANGLFDTEAVTKTATLWSKTIGTSVKAGTLYFSFNEKNLTATLTERATLTAGAGKSAYLYLQSSYEVWVENGSSKATLLKGEIGQATSSGVNPSKTATATGTYSTMTSVLFSPGDTIAIKATATVQAGGSYLSSSSTASVSAKLAASATLAIKFNSAAYSSKIPVYNNHYFGNGFMLSTASNKYLAASSAATDGNIIQARSTNALFKFTANGLLQSMNGGNAFYRVSPVVMAFSINYNSTTKIYTIVSHYNPFGKTMGDINRDSAGKITVNHNYGDWTFTFATAIDATYSVFCKVISFTSTSVTIGRIDRDGNYRDGNFQVMLFDFHTY